MSADAAQWWAYAVCNLTSGTDSDVHRRKREVCNDAVMRELKVVAEPAVSEDAVQWWASAVWRLSCGIDADVERRRRELRSELIVRALGVC